MWRTGAADMNKLASQNPTKRRQRGLFFLNLFFPVELANFLTRPLTVFATLFSKWSWSWVVFKTNKQYIKALLIKPISTSQGSTSKRPLSVSVIVNVQTRIQITPASTKWGQTQGVPFVCNPCLPTISLSTQYAPQLQVNPGVPDVSHPSKGTSA